MLELQQRLTRAQWTKLGGINKILMPSFLQHHHSISYVISAISWRIKDSQFMLPARTLCSGCTGHSGPLTSFLSLHYITLHYITLYYITSELYLTSLWVEVLFHRVKAKLTCLNVKWKIKKLFYNNLLSVKMCAGPGEARCIQGNIVT